MHTPNHPTTPNHIGPDDLSTTLQNRLGLVIGPGVSCSPNTFDDLSAHLAQRFHVSQGDSFLETADEVLDTTPSDHELFSIVSNFFTKPPQQPPLSRAAAIKWEAVLSFSIDRFFEDALLEAETRRPVGQVVTVLTDLRQPLFSAP